MITGVISCPFVKADKYTPQLCSPQLKTWNFRHFPNVFAQFLVIVWPASSQKECITVIITIVLLYLFSCAQPVQYDSLSLVGLSGVFDRVHICMNYTQRSHDATMQYPVSWEQSWLKRLRVSDLRAYTIFSTSAYYSIVDIVQIWCITKSYNLFSLDSNVWRSVKSRLGMVKVHFCLPADI